jgi:hypothetical protein
MALAPPFSTGGGGEGFEKLAGACALAALLAWEEIPGLDLPATKVRFQQRYAGHLLDDIVIDGASRGVRRTLEIQARHRPRLIASDAKFVELVAVFLRAMRDNPTAMRNDTRRLGLLLDPGTSGWKSLHQLTRLAWAHSDPAAFYQAIAAQGHTGEPIRKQLGQLIKAKAAADQASETAEDPELWMLLRGLRVLPWSLDESTGADRTTAINQLRRVLAADDPARAPDLFADLLKLVADLVPLAGGVTRMDLVAKLRARGQWQLDAGPRTGGAGQTAGLTGDDLVRGPLRNLGLDGEASAPSACGRATRPRRRPGSPPSRRGSARSDSTPTRTCSPGGRPMRCSPLAASRRRPRSAWRWRPATSSRASRNLGSWRGWSSSRPGCRPPSRRRSRRSRPWPTGTWIPRPR